MPRVNRLEGFATLFAPTLALGAEVKQIHNPIMHMNDNLSTEITFSFVSLA